MPEAGAVAPDDDTASRWEGLGNPAVVIRYIRGADAQFSGDAFGVAVEAMDAYFRSILPDAG